MLNPIKTTDFDAIKLKLASPKNILEWSNGEVVRPETINYRTQKPEKDGLFCEKIFGPSKDWECYCGKYKRIRYKGIICEKCGVEVTRSIVRRERMGHIKLAVPVTHIWYLRSTPSRIGLLLDLPIKTIEQVVYFAAYIITNVDKEAKKEAFKQLIEEHQVLRAKIKKDYENDLQEIKKQNLENREEKVQELEKDYSQKIEELEQQLRQAEEDLALISISKVVSELEYRDLSMKFGHIFQAGTGAESIRRIIENMDLAKLIEDLKEEFKKSTGQKQKKIIKRMKLAGSFLKANIHPEWMVLTILPVIPPDLRPMVQLDGGRFAASDLNDLYRRVINRNNRLKRLMEIGAPEVICRNEKRMLQEAVDTLLNNSARQGKTVFTAGDKRKLRSLSDMLKGKQGRFRQNLLGKRVDYSGRSVIVVGPQLKLHQCGLPKIMALELFKPFVLGRLIKEGYAHNLKNAEKLINSNRKEIWDILEDVTKRYHVLLNRAPTLHRLGIQAFQPILVEGKAIQIHPLVCAAFNADFDGDQMAVHVPLSAQAQKEAQEIMLSSNNLLKPSAGEPITIPAQDMILGCYYLTKINDKTKEPYKCFKDAHEAIYHYDIGAIHLQEKIKCRINNELTETSVGRILFNEIIPNELGYYNITTDKKVLKNIISDCYEYFGKEDITAKLCDEIKKIGFIYATKSGITISASDMIIPDEKNKIINDASEVVKEITNQYMNGLMTEHEKYVHAIKIWSETKSKVTTVMINSIDDQNDIAYMISSGARGNWGQITQLCGMKGLVANPAGKTIELPIKSNLKEGFSILEYFIATHGGRKGKSDTALKTAEAGYLTRRLVDAVQDIIIKENDCGSEDMNTVTRKESEQIGEAFENRIFGRILATDIIDPKTGEILVQKEKDIGNNELKIIKEREVNEVQIRSIMTCKTKNGICQRCYGKDLGTNKIVKIGTAVGIIAAQSIGEPGTQLTMRTFHMGGVAEGSDITQGLTRVEELFEARTPKSPAILSEIDGIVKIIKKGKQQEIYITSDGPVDITYDIPGDFIPVVEPGEEIHEKQVILKNKNTKKTLRSMDNGKIKEIIGNKIIITTSAPIEKKYIVGMGKSPKVKNDELVKKGTPITTGNLNLREFMRLTSLYRVQKYIINEVQSIYASQGQTINDKHLEIIARQMLSKIRVLEPGDSNYLPGEIVNYIDYQHTIDKLTEDNKALPIEERLLLGLTRIALFTDSWLSAASFQETIRVLVEASTTNKIDQLEGLKENVIIGKLIPAGETYRKKHRELQDLER